MTITYDDFVAKNGMVSELYVRDMIRSIDIELQSGSLHDTFFLRRNQPYFHSTTEVLDLYYRSLGWGGVSVMLGEMDPENGITLIRISILPPAGEVMRSVADQLEELLKEPDAHPDDIRAAEMCFQLKPEENV